MKGEGILFNKCDLSSLRIVTLGNDGSYKSEDELASRNTDAESVIGTVGTGVNIKLNPARTQLLLDAEKRGIIAENGLWMLVAQAREAAEAFTGAQISDTVIEKTHRMLQQQMCNIVLIGMPGCGKSTIAKLLSQELNRPVVDADEEISRAAGCPMVSHSETYRNLYHPAYRVVQL